MPQPQNYFKKITEPVDKLKILQDLAAARGEILCKGGSDFIFKFKAYKIEHNKLHCLIQADSDQFSLSQESLIASFFLGGEKYFFQAIAHYQNKEINFALNFDLFQLQRRQNYRVRIPDSYKSHLEIQAINGKKIKLKGNLNDISSGGCRASFKVAKPPAKPEVKMDDILSAQVMIGSRPPIEVTATVKHIRIEGADQEIQNLGLEFKPLSPQLENRIFVITMDLHRELFSKLT